MHVSMSVCMSVHTHFVCMHACVSECVFRRVYSAIYTHTLPGEIRLICQWCRSSSMINSPACWKQCYSALATCGTPMHCMWVSVFVCETAWISTLTSCTRCVDVVGLLLHKAATCRDSCELRTASLVTLPSYIYLTWRWNPRALSCCAHRLWHRWTLSIKWFEMLREQLEWMPFIAQLTGGFME